MPLLGTVETTKFFSESTSTSLDTLQFHFYTLHDSRTFSRDPNWSKSQADGPLTSVYLSLHRYLPWFDTRDSASPNSSCIVAHTENLMPLLINLWIFRSRAHSDMQIRGKPRPIYHRL